MNDNKQETTGTHKERAQKGVQNGVQPRRMSDARLKQITWIFIAVFTLIFWGSLIVWLL